MVRSLYLDYLARVCFWWGDFVDFIENMEYLATLFHGSVYAEAEDGGLSEYDSLHEFFLDYATFVLDGF